MTENSSSGDVRRCSNKDLLIMKTVGALFASHGLSINERLGLLTSMIANLAFNTFSEDVKNYEPFIQELSDGIRQLLLALAEEEANDS